MYGMLALLITFGLGWALWNSNKDKKYYSDLNNTIVKIVKGNTSKEYAKQFNREYKELKKKNKKGV